MSETAADLERDLVEAFGHNWCDPGQAVKLRGFLTVRLADELAEAKAKRAAGDRSDVWGEVRRLTEWIGTIDVDLLPRRAGLLEAEGVLEVAGAVPDAAG